MLARDPLPGGVEICSPSTYTLRSNIVAGVTGTSFAGGMGLVVGTMAFPTDPLLLFGLGGAAALAGAGFMAFDRLRPRVGLRILVLTPDGFVGGLDGGVVRAFLWPRVASFTNGRDALGEPALEVRAVDGSLMSRTAARFFGEPLDVVVAVAEAYRRRAVASLSG